MLSATNKEHGCCGNDKYSEVAQIAGQKLREVIDSTTEEARNATAITIKQARQHPVQFGAIAAGIGLLAGLLLKRR